MTQFDELYKALYGSYPPQRPKPAPPTNLLSFLSSAQPPPRPTPPPSLLKFKPATPQPAPPIFLRKPRVFVSFDYENNAHYKRLLEAWNKNSRFQFTFQDKTPQEIQSDDVGRVKAVLTAKVKDATHVLVLVGQYANQLHKDRLLIGSKNWINFEVKQAKLYRKKLVAVILTPYVTLPDELLGSGATPVHGFSQAAIMKALAEAKQYGRQA